MKIILVPNTKNFYDRRVLKEFGRALEQNNVEVQNFDIPITRQAYDYSSSTSSEFGLNKKDIYSNLSTDCLLEVNRLRSRHLNKKIRHIAWFQDVRPSDFLRLKKYQQNIKKGDLLYLLGDKKHFGMENFDGHIGCLLTGVDEKKIAFNSQNKKNFKFDINLMGYLSNYRKRPSVNLIQSSLFTNLREFLRSPRLVLKLLSEEDLDLKINQFQHNKFYVNIEQEILSNYKPLCGFVNMPKISYKENKINLSILNHLFIEIPRRRDREKIFEKLRMLQENGYKILIAGQNWQENFEDCTFLKPHIANPMEIYQDCKLTIHNNTHGLGIHSRVLECMAVGGFIMMHGSPHSHLPGGIDSTFEPDKHYGLYSDENLIEKCEYWIYEDEKRKKAVLEAQQILRSKHLWSHRAQQILHDLK